MAEWNKEAKHWESLMDNYDNCLREIREHTNKEENKKESSVMVYKIPDFVFKASEEMRLDLEIKNQLYAVAKTINYNQI